MKSNHAPAPWHIGEANPWLIYAADGYAVADTRTYHGRHPNPKMDAILIAAAPMMLAALQKIAANPGDCDMETGFTSGHIARAAIREALGQNAKAMASPPLTTKNDEQSQD